VDLSLLFLVFSADALCLALLLSLSLSGTSMGSERLIWAESKLFLTRDEYAPN
jgi:hypothetical protein